jgi:dTDP-glucose 4,6-dehydratase
MKSAETPGIEGQTFNLGVGKEVTMKDLAEIILEMIDHSVEIVIDKDRLRPQKSEVQRLLSDNQRARKILGWEPQVSLRDGLQKTIEWIKSHQSFYQPSKYQR